jgi:FAD/FMN-containing dehydrogenase
MIGIGGLTTGGGTGALTGQYGHIVDNLLSVRVALADGTVVSASNDSNSDLFWAIRGGGSNFGICTEFTYRAHPQGPVVL